MVPHTANPFAVKEMASEARPPIASDDVPILNHAHAPHAIYHMSTVILTC